MLMSARGVAVAEGMIVGTGLGKLVGTELGLLVGASVGCSVWTGAAVGS
jgi:hypothetical protein